MSREEEEERMIPVLTVLKNGAVLKNIFVISKPPDERNRKTEEILVVGRHPDCNIVLMHPSISRFHLQINSNPFSHKLFVTDLSSVHGTWVSEKKVEAGFKVEVNEGDTIRLGGSTRVYRLHWLPLSTAYDTEKPFVSSSCLPVVKEEEEEEEECGQVITGEHELNIFQDLNLVSVENEESQSSDLVLKDISSMFLDEDWASILDKKVPSDPHCTDNSCDANQEEVAAPCTTNDEADGGTLEFKDRQFEGQDHSPRHDFVSKVMPCREDKGVLMVQSDDESNDAVWFDSLLSSEESEEAQRENMNILMMQSENNSTDEVCFDSSLFSEDAEEPQRENMDVLMMQSENKSSDEVCFDSSLFSEDAEEPQRENMDVLMMQSEKKSSDEVCFDSSLFSEEHVVIEAPEETRNKIMFVDKHHEVDSFPLQIESFEIPLSMGDHLEKTSKENGTYDAPEPTYEDVNQENCLAYKDFIGLVFETACSDDQLAAVNCNSPSREKFGDCHVVSPVTESVNSSLPVGDIISVVIETKESQTPPLVFSPIENFEVRSERSSHNIWSRRGKAASALKLQTSRSRGNTIDELNKQGYTKDRSVTKALFSSSEEDTFTPDKENYSPSALLLKCLKKQSKLEEFQVSNSYCSPSPKHLLTPNIHLEENTTFSSDKENQTPEVLQPKNPNILLEENTTSSSDKENQTPKVLQPRKSGSRASKKRSILGQNVVLKEKRSERVPLQSLLSNSPGKSTSAPTAATTSCLSVSSTQTMQKINSLGEARRGWSMVVDTSSLLDKESRKSLQLLRGLKGTGLIIPRMVIRELDSLNRRGNLFRRTTEASLALAWIEECILNTRWWIHVQSSIEEAEKTALTPPASPHSPFTEENGGFQFWTTSTASASASPTSEDHIIDYAIFNRRLYNNGQLVLVSNDITLKIKAMAEGLICETAQEFRNSLVNPFSCRFLWADSSPRGQTWSVSDDVELKDKYYRSPSKKSSKGEGAKGLKLILLHNSQYGQNSWPVKTY